MSHFQVGCVNGWRFFMSVGNHRQGSQVLNALISQGIVTSVEEGVAVYDAVGAKFLVLRHQDAKQEPKPDARTLARQLRDFRVPDIKIVIVEHNALAGEPMTVHADHNLDFKPLQLGARLLLTSVPETPLVETWLTKKPLLTK